MVTFDRTKGQMLNIEQVALRLKVALPYLSGLIANGFFPIADKTVNGVQYWNIRTVEMWLGTQPRK